jgi:hypothetical protein
MRVLKILLLVGLSAAALGAAVIATGARTSVGCAGCPASPAPPVASQLAKNVAKASFGRQYKTVWSYLHPTYQKAISQSHWQRCQGAHPTAPRSVTIKKISIADSTPVPVNLPLLGPQKVQEVSLQVQFKTPATRGLQLALEYTFWLKQNGKWLAVWPAEEYSALKAGKCYLTPQGPGLY